VCAVAKGKPRGKTLVHLDKMAFVVVRQGRLDSMNSGQRKPTKAKKAKGDLQARVHLDKMALVAVRWGGLTG
jgi:hypothetical protein